jgi:hypothetical protein
MYFISFPKLSPQRFSGKEKVSGKATSSWLRFFTRQPYRLYLFLLAFLGLPAIDEAVAERRFRCHLIHDWLYRFTRAVPPSCSSEPKQHYNQLNICKYETLPGWTPNMPLCLFQGLRLVPVLSQLSFTAPLNFAEHIEEV